MASGYRSSLDGEPIYTAEEIEGCNRIYLDNIIGGAGNRKLKKSNPISK